MQRLGQGGTKERKWQHRILTRRRVVGAEAGTKGVSLDVRDESCGGGGGGEDAGEDEDENEEKTAETRKTDTLHFDAVIVAAGYSRDMHQTILAPLLPLLPHADIPHANTTQADKPHTSNTFHTDKHTSTTNTNTTTNANTFAVRRDYSIPFDSSKVNANAGVWLQGCNESSHGLSDTLLSILATRGGELVESILGDARYVGR